MKIPALKKTSALTLIELVVIVAALLLLAALYLPKTHQRKEQAQRIACISNLKHMGIACKLREDYGSKYSMQFSTNYGGSMEFAGGSDMFRHFEVMSNELNSPVILFCPAESDLSRRRATFFTSLPARGSASVPFTGNTNVSYFLSMDAIGDLPAAFLSGDRNLLTNGIPFRDGLLELTTNSVTGWRPRELHGNQGNIGLADGSVMRWDSAALQRGLAESALATNRLAMP